MHKEQTGATASALIAKLVLATCLAVSGTIVSPVAKAKSASEQATQAKSDKASRKPSSTKAKVYKSPSEETTAERDRRLYRECKGMNNAGACKGYTRK